MTRWFPLVVQTIALLAGGVGYAIVQEHRLTIIEESVKTDKYLLEQQQKTQDMMVEQLRITQQTLDRLVTMEDFFHGQMSKDERDAYHRRFAQKP